MADTTPSPEKTYYGIAASPGLALGQAFLFFHEELEVPTYSVETSMIDAEKQRFQAALNKTRKDIQDLRARVEKNLSEEEAKIFDAHIFVLDDNALIEQTYLELEQSRYNIEFCYKTASQKFIDAFDKIDDEYIKDRASDIKDVVRRVLGNLTGAQQSNWMSFEGQRVLVSEDISPSDTAEISREKILGIVTNKGSRTSHSVIMARSLQVPAVVGLHDITESVLNHDLIIVDGYDGKVIVNPTEDTMARYEAIKHEKASLQAEYESVRSLEPETRDGVRVSLTVNIEGRQDVEKAQSIENDGVGLFRTEALFLRRDHAPDEEEQFEEYKAVVEGMKGKPVTIRTIDLGGDKRISGYFLIDEELNPFMGFRAIRLCLAHTSLFKEQLRAILRASAFGKVRLMYPMITSAQEIEAANDVLDECKRELRQKEQAFDEEIEVGCMIETPSAAMTIDLIAKHASFVSIGTNDLIQYLLAVDRVNDRIAYMYQPNHPAVIRTLTNIVTQAKAHGLAVSVCGEMAGDPLYAALFVGLGVNNLSITPTTLTEIKYLIRQISAKEATQMAEKTAEDPSPHDVLHRLRNFYLANLRK